MIWDIFQVITILLSHCTRQLFCRLLETIDSSLGIIWCSVGPVLYTFEALKRLRQFHSCKTRFSWTWLTFSNYSVFFPQPNCLFLLFDDRTVARNIMLLNGWSVFTNWVSSFSMWIINGHFKMSKGWDGTNCTLLLYIAAYTCSPLFLQYHISRPRDLDIQNTVFVPLRLTVKIHLQRFPALG